MCFARIFNRAVWALAAGGLGYILTIIALTSASVQRNALYAHRVNPTLWQDLSVVEQFGFLHRQVQPFTLVTPNNATIFAWHILPLHLYLDYEAALLEQPEFGVKSSEHVVDSVAFRILANDPNAQVIVNFHGNAAHLASSQRPSAYVQQLGVSVPERPVHVIAFDYRGFGLSSRSPTEAGLITDAETLLLFLTGYTTKKEGTASFGASSAEVASSPSSLALKPSNIVLFGQSLGTAVATAVLHRWTIVHALPTFRAMILVSGFTSLPKLLESYSLKGIVPPMLSPLNALPGLKRSVVSKIADTWETDRRIIEIVSATPPQPLDLTIMHAYNDWEIPWAEGKGIWDAAMFGRNGSGIFLESTHGTTGSEDKRHGHEVKTWADDSGQSHVRWERVWHGGHNKVAASQQAMLAIERVLSRVKS